MPKKAVKKKSRPHPAPSSKKLHLRVAELEKLDRQRQRLAKEGLKTEHDLRERVKELDCLYAMSRLDEKVELSLEQLLEACVEIIPPSWQYPEITCARITLERLSVQTGDFRTSRWKQASDIVVNGKRIGSVEVLYLKKCPKSDEGPFLKEERALIDAIATRLGTLVERRRAEETLQKRTHDLTERVKELMCLYGVARLVETCGDSVGRLLQGIADLLPPSWQYPEVTCARLVFEDKEYVTARFRRTRHRQSADLVADGKKVGQVEVCYLKKMPESDEGPFLKEERALIDAVAERIGRIVERMRATEGLRRAHKELEVERAALQEANAALRAVLARIEDEKRDIRETILANVDKILMPILHALEIEATPQQGGYVDLLKRNLEEIASPFIDKLSKAYLSLTPVEIQVCNMIRSGLTTKEIAHLRHVSPATICRHREHVRRKLGITNKDINLATYLQTFGPAFTQSASRGRETSIRPPARAATSPLPAGSME